MKAISIKQPFASLILEGKKTIETRTWKTDYRGPLLVCAAKQPHNGMVMLPNGARIGRRLAEGLPSAVMLCVVDLVGCEKMRVLDYEKSYTHLDYDQHPNLWAWKLANVRPVQPSAIRGQLRLFEVPDQKISYLHMGQ